MADINNKLMELGYKQLYEKEKNDPDKLANLTQKIGYKVPEDYQQFLMDYPNTGTFSYMVEAQAIEPVACVGDDKYLPISLLFASCKTRPSYNLLNAQESDILPPGLIFIGQEFGNYFCLSLNDENFGKVYYLDNEEYLYDKESGKIEGLYLVSNDFSSFICSLRIDPDS